MAAIAYPRPAERRQPRPTNRQPHLRVVAPSRPSGARAAGVYRRRRLLVLITIALLAVVLGLAVVGARTLLGTGVGSPANDAWARPAPAGRVHVVQPGDTLWTVARSLDPDADIRAIVDELSARHGPGPLRVGERLALDG